MKTVAASISTFLANNPQQYLLADAYTFTLQSGTVLRYTNAQQDFTLGANTFSSAGPLFVRSTIRQMRGVEVDTLDLTITDVNPTLINGVPFMQALRSGMFDAATLVLNRIFFSAPGVLVNSSGTGDIILFSGRVADIDVGRFVAQMRVNSDLELLNIQLPRNVYQPGCLNTVYDSGCTLAKATWQVSGTALAGSTSGALQVSMAQADGWFDQGLVTFTSGVNVGITRTVRTYAGGVMTLIAPFPNAPASGDTFTARPGCDKSQATCQNKFSNLANFRGHPYVPIVTSVVSV